MHSLEWWLDKSRAVIQKGPAVLRNIIYARFGYWPVGSIHGSELQKIPTYCISLTRATQKRRLIRQQVEQLGLEHFEFIDAVDASLLSREDLIRDGRLDDLSAKQFHEGGLTVNEVACSLSHAAAYAIIVERGDPVALILEDDALFVSRRMRRFRLTDIPPDFDLVFLNAFRFEEPPRGRLEGMVYDTTSYSGSAAAYLVSQRGARKLNSAAHPVVHAADGLVGRCLELPPGEAHPFKQVGVSTVIRGYMVYPDCVLNGSTSHYHVSDVQVR